MSLAGCQINLIDVNFHLQKSLQILDKKSAEKIWSKKDMEIKVSPLMPIRVNQILCRQSIKKRSKDVKQTKYFVILTVPFNILFYKTKTTIFVVINQSWRNWNWGNLYLLIEIMYARRMLKKCPWCLSFIFVIC